MFGKLLGKNKEETKENDQHSVIVEKVSKMNLTDMKMYVNNKLTDFKICEDGVNEVMRKLISKDAKEKRFIESDAMDSKIKKAFDLVILIGTTKYLTVVTLELIQNFSNLYKDIILKFDKDNMQIYESKLKDSLTNAIAIVQTMSEMQKKMKVLGG